jgi:hypothetical protein
VNSKLHALASWAPAGRIGAEFETARPRILGACWTHWCMAFGRSINVHLERLPRMADFSLWAAACETAVWPAGTLARVYGSQPHSCHREHPQLPPTEASILMRRGRASPNCRRDDRFAKNGRWKRVCVRRRPIEIARGVCGHMIPTCGRRRS